MHLYQSILAGMNIHPGNSYVTNFKKIDASMNFFHIPITQMFFAFPCLFSLFVWFQTLLLPVKQLSLL